MSSFLDEFFSNKTPEVLYAWTWTDVDVPSGIPHVSFATGILSFKESPLTREYYTGPRRYVDTSVKPWSASGTRLNPSSFGGPPGWVDQLMILPSASGYIVLYGKRANFGVEVGSFAPEVYNGGGFPGYPAMRTVVLTCRVWLGVTSIVLTIPGEGFTSLREPEGTIAQQSNHCIE